MYIWIIKYHWFTDADASTCYWFSTTGVTMEACYAKYIFLCQGLNFCAILKISMSNAVYEAIFVFVG